MTNYQKIVKFNFAGNGLRYDVELEDKLFEEEVKETIQAIANDNLVEMLDGLCDIKFVLEGTKVKLLYNGFYFNDQQKEDILQSLIDEVREIFNNIEYEGSFTEILVKAYEIVCDANLEKLIEGVAVIDGTGKILKPEGFISPNQKILDLLESVNLLS